MAKTIIVKKAKLPDLLPHGWKKEVAGILGIHVNTVTNALKTKKGYTYVKIIEVLIEKWGEIENIEKGNQK